MTAKKNDKSSIHQQNVLEINEKSYKTQFIGFVKSVAIFLFIIVSCFFIQHYLHQIKTEFLTPDLHRMKLQMIQNHVHVSSIHSRPVGLTKFTNEKNAHKEHSFVEMKWNTMRNTVVCFDRISAIIRSVDERNVLVTSQRKTVQFVFIGDSRIRQHFLNFRKLVPDIDLEYKPRYNSYYKIEEDMNVTSQLFDFRLAYYFRRFLGNDTTDVFSRLDRNSETGHVNRVILVGISLHHMLDGNGAINYENYMEQLKQLKPILHRVSNGSKVIWLNQYPAIDSFGPLNSHAEVFSEKIQYYNLATERILRDSGVTIWNSGNHMVEEYIRSCVLLERADLKYFGNAYFNCLDYVHPGYSALSAAIQLLLNEVCDGPPFNDDDN